MAEQEKASRRPPRKVGVRAFRGNFAGFMRQVRKGSSFAVTSHDEVIAIVHPPAIRTSPTARHVARTDRDGTGRVRDLLGICPVETA